MPEASERAEARDYFRIETELPLRMRPIESGEKLRLEHEILHRGLAGELQLDPELAGWLDRLETKLDRILLHLGVENPSGRPIEMHSVVLSGGGMRVRCEDHHATGALLLVEFELPGPPAHGVRCLAAVVRDASNGDGPADLALHFLAIHAEDREAVVRHTLDVQRRELRSRSTLRDEE